MYEVGMGGYRETGARCVSKMQEQGSVSGLRSLGHEIEMDS